MNVTRIQQNTSALITWTAYEDGTQTDIGTITIGIDDQDGTEIVAAGTSVTDNADGTYEYALDDSKTGTLGRWTVTWTESGGEDWVTYVEIVGSVMVGEADIRTFDNSAMTSASAYSDAAIARARDNALDRLEHWTGRSWIPRFAQVKMPGTGNHSLYLNDGIRQYGGSGWKTDILSIVSGSINGTAITASNVVANRLTSELIRTDGLWSTAPVTNPHNVTINYTYGIEHPFDGVERIVMMLIREELVASNISSRTTSITNDLGWTERYETPGRLGAVTTMPEVNEWVRAHSNHLFIG
jgi:hypothetical protein